MMPCLASPFSIMTSIKLNSSPSQVWAYSKLKVSLKSTWFHWIKTTPFSPWPKKPWHEGGGSHLQGPCWTGSKDPALVLPSKEHDLTSSVPFTEAAHTPSQPSTRCQLLLPPFPVTQPLPSLLLPAQFTDKSLHFPLAGVNMKTCELRVGL